MHGSNLNDWVNCDAIYHLICSPASICQIDYAECAAPCYEIVPCMLIADHADQEFKRFSS